jgi:hypothetical protein
MTYTQAVARGIVNIVALIIGAVLLSYQFGWKVGVGVSCLAYFLKNPEHAGE